jgi:hypothetical protein
MSDDLVKRLREVLASRGMGRSDGNIEPSALCLQMMADRITGT